MRKERKIRLAKWQVALGMLLGIALICGGLMFYVGIGPLDIGPSARDLPAAVQAYKKAGWPWTAKEVDPRPAPTEAEDATPQLLLAISSLDENAANKAFNDVGKPMQANDYRSIGAIVKPFNKSIDLAEAAAAKTRINFQRDYDMGPMMRFPELAQEKSLTKLMMYRAEYNAAIGDSKAAGRDLSAILNFSRLSGEEPNLISMLVQIAEEAIAYRGYEVCAEQLASNPSGLQDLKDSLRPPAMLSLPFHLRSEAYMGVAMLRNTSQYGGVSGMMHYVSSDNSGEGTQLHLDPTTLQRDGLPTDLISRAFLDKHLRYWSERNASFTGDPEALSKTMDEQELKMNGEHKLSTVMLQVLAPVFSQAGQAVKRCDAFEITTEAFLDGMIIHAKTGSFPKTIEEIPGKWIDPFDGKPLRVKATGHSFRVYSIGPDRVDDGGVDQSEKRSVADHYDLVVMYPSRHHPRGTHP